MDKKRRRLPTARQLLGTTMTAALRIIASQSSSTAPTATTTNSSGNSSSRSYSGHACCRPMAAINTTGEQANDRLHSSVSTSGSELRIYDAEQATMTTKTKLKCQSLISRNEGQTTMMIKFKKQHSEVSSAAAAVNSSGSHQWRSRPITKGLPMLLLLVTIAAQPTFLVLSQNAFAGAEEQAQVIVVGGAGGEQLDSAATLTNSDANKQVSSGNEAIEQQAAAGVAANSNRQTESGSRSNQRQQQSADEVQATAAGSSLAIDGKDSMQSLESAQVPSIVASEQIEQQQLLTTVADSKFSQSDSTSTVPSTTLSPAQQQIIDSSFEPQVHEDIPLVSGLVGQDEFQQQQLTEAPQTLTTEAVPQDSQSSLQQVQQQQQQQVDADQQLIAAVGGIKTESDSLTRLHNAENGASLGFGRKNLNEQQQTSDNQQQRPQTANGAKGRSSNKRTHQSGHLGVFGRKRSQSTGSNGKQDELQPSFVGTHEAPAETRARNGRKFQYYYTVQHQSGATASTRAPTTTRPTKSKLRNADFPDYREILIQPDQVDTGRLQQQQQVQRQPESQLQQQQQKQAADSGEQALEQAHVQVSDSEFANEEQQLTSDGQQEIAGASAGSVEQSAADAGSSSSSQQEQQQQEQQQQLVTAGDAVAAAPYIRLSNIATINSTGSSSSGNSSSGGGSQMKLMRIYVIDLDQKLVVGNNQPGAANLGESVQYSLPDQTPSAAAAQVAQEPQYSSAPAARPTESPAAGQAYASSVQTATPMSTLAPQYSPYGEQQQQQLQGDLTTVYEPQGQALPFIPEGYVLLDRDSLQGNLSAMFAQMQQQQLHAMGGNRALNYSATPMYLPPLFGAPANYSAAPTPLGYFPAPTAVAPGAHQVVMSMPIDQTAAAYPPLAMYNQQQQQRPVAIDYSGANQGSSAQVSGTAGDVGASAYGATSVSYSNASAAPTASSATAAYASHKPTHGLPNNHYQALGQQQQHDRAQPQQIAAIYSQPVPTQQQQTQVYQSVPQYIAPQYKGIVNNPDSEYEWQQQQQQQQHYGAEQRSSAPGQQHQQQQVRSNNATTTNYNTSNTGYGNYSSSKPAQQQPQSLAHFVQAPAARQQQDRHHANSSSSGSSGAGQYLSHQEASAAGAATATVYQQPTAASSAAGYSAQTLALSSSAAYGEPGQQQQQQYSEPAVATYKVTTANALASEHHWKPVDYSAPASSSPSSTSSAAAAYPQAKQQQSSISPAQYTNNRPAINGYNNNNNRDQDVASPASVASVRQQQQHYAGQQRQHRAHGNYSAPSPSYDDQHAPLNYQQQQQPRKSSPHNSTSGKQAYVNSSSNRPQQSEYQQPSPTAAFSSGHDASNSATGYSGHSSSSSASAAPSLAGTQAATSSDYAGANDAPSQQVPTLVGARAHPSLAGYQYNGTGPALNGQLGAQETEYQVQGAKQQHSGAGYAQVNSNQQTSQYQQQQQQYGTGPAAAYGQPPKQKLVAPVDQSSEAPRIPHSQPSRGQQVTSSDTYKQQQAYNGAGGSGQRGSTPPTAYMAVHGPPVADAVYDSEEAALAAVGAVYQQQATKTAGARPSRLAKQRPPKGRPVKQAPRFKDPPESEYYNTAQEADNQFLSSAGEDASANYYNSYHSSQQKHQQRPYMKHQGGQRGLHGSNGNQNYYSPRPPMSSAPSKGLLSWETISSVASGAAKRLPSLSSILTLPFGSSSPVKSMYQHHHNNHHHQQQQPYGSGPLSPTGYGKSAHYDRDVSAFHRPYPQRHMNHHHTQSYNAEHQAHGPGAKPPSSNHQAGEASQMEIASHGGEYDLSSSSSTNNNNNSPDSLPDPSLSSGPMESSVIASGQVVGDANLAASAVQEQEDASSNGEQLASQAAAAAAAANGDSVALEGINGGKDQAERPSGAGKFNRPQIGGNLTMTLVGEKGAEVADLAEINPSAMSQMGPQQQQAGKGPLQRRLPTNSGPKKQRPRAQQVQIVEEVMTIPAGERPPSAPAIGNEQAINPEHAGVLSSIEHELVSAIDGSSGVMKSAPKPLVRRRPKKGNIKDVNGAPFVDPTAIELDPDGSPAAQPHLSLLGAHEKPGSIMFHGEQNSAELGTDGEPTASTASTAFGMPSIGLGALTGGIGGDRPQGRPILGSVQIGQYKITPQTQFMQSIIEPSRQMIGQYFKQYIGQFAGR